MQYDSTVSPTPALWKILGAAPHRPLFLVGAAQLVLTMLWWIVELAGRADIVPVAPASSTLLSTWTHGFLMLYGLFTFFICGFLFTVFPRWMAGQPVPAPRFVAVAVLLTAGLALFYAGLLLDRRVLALGLALYGAGLVTATVVLYDVYRWAPRHGTHERLLLAELALGALGVASFLFGVLANNVFAFVVAREIGLWGFLVPVLLTVCHRMIPFFTQSALPFSQVPRPAWSLSILVGGSLLHGLLELAAWPVARLVVDLVLAVVALHHSVIWGLRRSFAVRLLAMLHVAFLWFGIGMTLYVVQTVLDLAGIDVLGRAPLHAIAIGFVTGTLVAMATRVTLGHAGLALAVKAPTWFLFLGLNAVVLLRIGAELLPLTGYHVLNLLAVAGWLVCLVPWVGRYAPIYLRPRADRHPG